jgi:hypothetical protein
MKAAHPSMSIGTEDREFQEYQKAVTNSVQPQQESGVVNVEKSNFGPATRDHYPTAQWAMTLASEMLSNPEPIDRKREEGTPAFIKPTVSEHYLAPLITILHSIPIAREALLETSVLLPSYGQNDEWWNGTAIERSRVSSQDGEDFGRGMEVEIIYEAQRLMAFLDGTVRAYGSAEVLAGLEGVKDISMDKIVPNFLESWQTVAERLNPDDRIGSVFRSSAYIRRMDPNDHEESEERRHFWVLETGTSSFDFEGASLYDTLDELLWTGFAPNDTLYLDSVGEVLTMLVAYDDSENRPRPHIPAVLYLDRYLKPCSHEAIAIRAQKGQILDSIKHMDEVREKLTVMKIPGRLESSSMDVKTLLQASIKHFEQPMPSEMMNGVEDGRMDIDRNRRLSLAASKLDIARELSSMVDRVDKKLQCKFQSSRVWTLLTAS